MSPCPHVLVSPGNVYLVTRATRTEAQEDCDVRYCLLLSSFDDKWNVSTLLAYALPNSPFIGSRLVTDGHKVDVTKIVGALLYFSLRISRNCCTAFTFEY